MNVRKEMQRIVRDALEELGGTGGKRQCRYCLRTSFRGDPEHYRNDGEESDEHCVVTVLRAALAIPKGKKR